MQPIVGIICEYDPFHLGHKRQFELIRKQLPDAFLLCIMSGCFTQRGLPALHSPAMRVRAALNAGADMVLELPCAFAVRDAEHFALGGVSLLNSLSFVTHLSFGAEDDISYLYPAVRLLEEPDDVFQATLTHELATGCSFATAQGHALSQCLPANAEALRKPNNILALCYLRALLRLHSHIKPLPVQRVGTYHDPQLPVNPAASYPSATAVRAAFLRGERQAAATACGYSLPASPICGPNALDTLLLYKLRNTPTTQLAALPLCSEGLENRLRIYAKGATSREELMTLLKTKRYARARLSRLCTHALLGITQAQLTAQSFPDYTRLLGFRKGSEKLLTLFNQSKIPIISKAADGDFSNPLYLLDAQAYDLWALGAGLPAGLMTRQEIVIV